MILLQISAAQGPMECCLAVAKAFQRMQIDAQQLGVDLQVLETNEAECDNTFKSILVSLEGDASIALARSWCGTVLWIVSSPYRPKHKRKNWFIGIQIFQTDEAERNGAIRFEATRASGPGGQHVNKTDSAIRATHLATGISVKVQTARSQFSNKKLAILLIAKKIGGTC